MKKILAMAAALCMAISMFASCGGNDDAGGSGEATTTAAQNTDAAEDTDEDGGAKAEEGTEAEEGAEAEDGADNDAAADDSISAQLLAEFPVNDGAYDVSNGATENMIGRSLINRGDTTRLAEKIDYALNNPKETTNICYFGDSITAGSGAGTSTNAYQNQVTTWWEENVSFYVNPIKAGIGATDSYCGVHRAYRDALAENPDIIIIEFINDLNDDFYASTMDSLVRMCLAQENNPAVLIVEPSCEDGSSPQDVHLKVAQGYDIPMISYHDAVMPEIDAGNFTWRDVSPDTVHPNDNGHIIMAQCITDLFNQIKENIDNEEKVSVAFDPETPAPAGNPFEGAVLGSRETTDIVKVVDEGTFTNESTFQNFTGGWGTSEGGRAEFEITCKNLGMLYMKTTQGYGMQISVTVDDNDPVIIDGDFPNGWGDFAKADPIYSSDEAATHKVVVECIDDDVKNRFDILNWLIS